MTFIYSYCSLLHALTAFNAKVISNDDLSIEEAVDHPHRQQLRTLANMTFNYLSLQILPSGTGP